ncbi:MAG: hypothetical protein WCS28_11845, partial [Thiomicrospira sp.]
MSLNVRFFNPDTLLMIGEVREITSLIFVRSWTTFGKFEIHVKTQRPELYKKNNIIMLDADGYKSGIITGITDNTDGYGVGQLSDITVSGYSLLFLLYGRYSVPDATETKDGYYTYTKQPAEDIMVDLVKKNCVNPVNQNRIIPHLYIADSQKRGGNYTFQSRLKRTTDDLAELCSLSGLGVAVRFDYENKKFIFEVLEGVDRTYSDTNKNQYVFSRSNNKVTKREYKYDAAGQATTGIVAGEGDGEDRTIVMINDEKTGLDRWEAYIDARDVQSTTDTTNTKETLKDRGLTKLSSMGAVETYTFDINPVDYQTRWDLGDVCTFYDSKQDYQRDDRITEVQETYENGYRKIDPTFGTAGDTVSQSIGNNSTTSTNERAGVSNKFKTLFADYAVITELVAKKATIEQLEVTNENVKTLQGEYVTVNQKLVANAADISDLQAYNVTVQGQLDVNSADIKSLNTSKANIDLANVKAGSITTALIGTGAVDTAQIADGSITDAKIVGLTANKITAGTLDAAHIDVVNLNAANITVGTINGKQIAPGAVDISKLGTDVTGEIDNAQSTADTANTAAGKAQTTADGAQSTADTANSNAGKAQDTANAANSTANTANATANTANATANTAKTNAATAQKDATQALADAKAASDAATKAQTAADKAQTDVDTAETDLANTKTSLTGALGRLDVTEKDIATAQADVKTAQSTVDTANSAASTANTAAGKAQTAANGAQTTANSAQSAANAAQSTADTAKANAANAQSTADTANTTANATKTIAESNTKKITNDEAQIATLITNTTLTTDGKTVQLKDAYSETVDDVNGLKTTVSSQQGTLDTATGDIKNIKSLQSTTTTDLNGLKNTVTSLSSTVTTVSNTASAAKTAAATAQTTADAANTNAGKAQTAANTAQSAANTANTAAGKAQSTADTATTKADTAQATADKKADQTDLDGLTTTVTKNYSDLSNTIDGFKSTVSSTYATQTTVNAVKSTADTAVTNASTAQTAANKAQATADGIEVGGRNLIANSDVNATGTYPTSSYTDVYYPTSIAPLN